MKYATAMMCLAAALMPVRIVAADTASAPDIGSDAAIPVHVTAPDNGLLSLGVYNENGTLIRSLAAAQKVESGPLNLGWDATNDLGLPVTPGNYSVHGVWFAKPPKANYLMKVGISGDPPYPLADGTGGWGGNLFCPQDLCSNGKDLIATFGCVEDNLNTGVQRMDTSGKVLGRYHTFFGWDTRLANAIDDGNLYLAIANRAGLPHRLVIAKYDIGKPAGKILTDIPAGDHQEPIGKWKGRWDCDVRGMAVTGGRIYVPVLLDDKLFVLDSQTGATLKVIDIKSPRGIAAHGGSLYLLSGTTLLRLDQDGATVATVISKGLEDPSGVAIDTAGQLYITDRGNAQQVKVFSPDGKLLRTIGTTGGRPRNGRYDPKGMLDPRGLCIGPDGNVWVASSAEDFQRVSVWNPATGDLVREFFNTRLSSGQGKLSPDRSEMIFNNGLNAEVPGITGYSLNWDKGTWYPAWHYGPLLSETQQNDVLVGHKLNAGPQSLAFDGRSPYLSYAGDMIKADNGHTYILGDDASVWLFDDESKAPKLLSLVYAHRVAKRPDGGYEGKYDAGPNSWFAWSDLNGDGRMSLDEVKATDNLKLMTTVGRPFACELQKDLSILMVVGLHVAKTGPPDKWALYRLPAHQVQPDGLPVYDWSDLKLDRELQVPSFVGGDAWKGGETTSLQWLDTADGFTFMRSQPRPAPGVKLNLAGIDGDGWWASRNWRLSPMKFNLQTGQPSWLMLGHRAPGKARPGEMYYPWTIMSHVDGFCFVPDAFAQNWVWTDDGLFVGRLYNDSTEGVRDSNGVFIEEVGAYVYKINGKVYGCIGDQGVWVHELNLPKLTPIDGGSVTVTPEIAAAAKKWDPDGPQPGKKPVYLAHSIWDYPAEHDWMQKHKREPMSNRPDFHLRTITVDGRLDDAEWGDIQPMTISMDNKPVAKVKVAFDRENLYLAYDVTDPVGLKNSGTELPSCPFTSGAYVDFRIGKNWTTPNRNEDLEGDVRVILAHITGAEAHDYQMGYYPVRAKFAQHPETITSPAAHRHFDDISPLPGLKWAWQPNEHGYTVEVSVPMQPGQTLNLSPNRDSQIGFDVSVGFANPEGTTRQRAPHWAGESEATVVDRPGSAALMPSTWGTLVFERSEAPVVPAKLN